MKVGLLVARPHVIALATQPPARQRTSSTNSAAIRPTRVSRFGPVFLAKYQSVPAEPIRMSRALDPSVLVDCRVDVVGHGPHRLLDAVDLLVAVLIVEQAVVRERVGGQQDVHHAKHGAFGR